MIKYLLLLTLFVPQFVFSQFDDTISNTPPQITLKTLPKTVDQFPIFIGCEAQKSEKLKSDCTVKKLIEFVYKNLRYPADAVSNSIEGTVVAKFVIDKDGSMKNIEIVRDIGGGCGDELKRVLSILANQPQSWIAATSKGESVQHDYTFPCRFRLK